MEQNTCECGGLITYGEPHYIPIGTDSILELIDSECKNCNTTYVGGQWQKIRMIKNQELNDKLTIFYRDLLHKQKTGTDTNGGLK